MIASNRNLTSGENLITVGILTASDTREENQDESGKAVRESLAPLAAQIERYAIVPDEKEIISSRLKDWADKVGVDLILTTGGTGLSSRDVTPEATLAVVERLAPGFTEVMRAESLKFTPLAMLSRAVAGIRKKTLIINLPGSPQAVRECLEAILPVIPHAVEVLREEAEEYATKEKSHHTY